MRKFLKAIKKPILFVILMYILVSMVLSFLDNSVSNQLEAKTWIHRVNSTEKLQEVTQKQFHGIELDVVFLMDEQRFDVNHPPAKSINLSLLDYLNTVDKIGNLRFWIDFKNLTASNAYTAVSRFDSISKALKIKKEQFIIESENPQFLRTFQNSGFKTSYYLPTSLCTIPQDEMEKELTLLRAKVNNYATDYISLDKCNYDLMVKEFPGKQKLLWSFPSQNSLVLNPKKLIKMPKQLSLKRRLLADNAVEVVLFGYEAKSGNR